MKVTVNRPSPKTAGNSEASVKKIRDYCTRLFYAPKTPVPASLAAFKFIRVASCSVVGSMGDRLRAKGPRQVDLVYQQYRDSIGSDQGDGSHTLNGLSKKDMAAIKSFQQIIDRRSQSLEVPSVL